MKKLLKIFYRFRIQIRAFHHGVSVATLAVTLSQHLKLFDQKQRQLMTLGSLLHDYGHFNSTVEFNKPKSQMTKDELKIYNNHHSVGAQAFKV